MRSRSSNGCRSRPDLAAAHDDESGTAATQQHRAEGGGDFRVASVPGCWSQRECGRYGSGPNHRLSPLFQSSPRLEAGATRSTTSLAAATTLSRGSPQAKNARRKRGCMDRTATGGGAVATAYIIALILRSVHLHQRRTEVNDKRLDEEGKGTDGENILLINSFWIVWPWLAQESYVDSRVCCTRAPAHGTPQRGTQTLNAANY